MLHLKGVYACPETGAVWKAAEHLVNQGWMDPSEKIVLFNTGATQKYVEFLETSLPSIDKANVDWSSLA